MYKFYTQKKYKGRTYTILRKEFRNFRLYGIVIDNHIKDSFSITQPEYHAEEFLLNKLVEVLHKKHFTEVG